MTKGTPHIQPNGVKIAKTVLMPGDPLRAKYIADNFLENVEQFNDVRNMFGYTGTYKGKEVSVMGFPLGASTTATKAFETEDAIQNGADEIDMVINIGALKNGRFDDVQQDIEAVVKAAKGHTVKVIIETVLLDHDEIVKASELTKAAGADFVKTSTGFAGGGATAEDVKLMKDTVGADVEVKASGGVRNLEDFNKMVEAGATRIGASAGVQIMQGLEADSDY